MKLPHRRQFLHLAVGAAALPVLSHVARAQSYPSHPITMIVPYPAGGPLDTIARIMAEAMRGSLGQPVIIENVTGAGGTVGTARAARAAPDGYTLSGGNVGTHVVSPATYPTIQYEPLKDFEPVALLATSAYWIIAKNSLPPKDLKELIAWLKANPDKASAAMVGTGGLDQIAGTYFQQKTGTRFQFVPYRGAAPAIQDLVAGHVDLKFDAVAASLAPVRSGQLKAYVVLGKARWYAAPEIPTIDEMGVPGMHVTFWHGLWVPKGTPREIVAKLNGAVVDTLADVAVRQRLTELGHVIATREEQTPEALGAFHRAEIEKWWPIIKAANIKAE